MNPRTSDLWWKNAVIYCLDVETYLDWDGDGRGDLAGLAERIDYLAGIGVSCIWLMPFQPSPNRDDGYDVTDHYAIDPRLGTFGDFVELVRAAKDRGLRVLIDLVVNHTSDRHPWFRSARSSRDSPYRDWYVWVDEPPAKPDDEVVFPDAEDSIWTFDEKAGQWYLHHFYAHQPDLNIGNPAVRDEIAKIAGFWLELGVDGFRVDAVPFLIETGGLRIDGEAVALDPHEVLRDLRSFMSRRRGNSVMLGEVNLPPEQLVEFFGDDDELQLLFDFPLMQALYLGLARGAAVPVRAALERRPPTPKDSQWATFLRNHDELTLDQLPEDERAEVFAAFAPEERMQLFGRGIRRRLPPMLDGNPERVRMAYSLLFSLPGTPVLFYGEEIGMGENLDVAGRLSVRTPMQWTDEANGGFSGARASRLPRRPPDGPYGPLAVNAGAQRRDPDSLLNWMERVIRRRRETPEIGWGAPSLLEVDDDRVLAHRCDWEGTAFVGLHNFAAEPLQVRVDLGPVEGLDAVIDLLDRHQAPRALEPGTLAFTLGAHGYAWLRLQPQGRATTP